VYQGLGRIITLPYPADSKPRVTIGLPVYNGAGHIEAAINSMLSQTFGDFELLICDNASTDATRSICERHASRDPRIVYVRQPENLGAAANYNHAFKRARGDYFKWAAHDDLLAPDYLQACVDVLDNDPACVLVHPATVIIDDDGQELYCYLDHLACDSDDPVDRFGVWMRPTDGMCNPVFGLVRREIMAQTCLHGTFMGADRVFLAEIALRGKVRCIEAGLFLRRVHAAMSTRANRDSAALDRWYTGVTVRRIRFKYWRRLGEFARMLTRVPMTAGQRARCFAILGYWAMRRGDRLLRELMLPFYMNGRPTALGRLFGPVFGGKPQQQDGRP
jgi:glycosyltransferase involved in cell wall biosynthesis